MAKKGGGGNGGKRGGDAGTGRFIPTSVMMAILFLVIKGDVMLELIVSFP
jgi:hypothetical protein